MFKLQSFWPYAFVAPLFWFLYWIGYDVLVWNKALFEVNPVNHVGAVLSLAVVFAGSQISRVKNKEIKRTQQASTKTTTCSHNLGYLSQRQRWQEMPEECMTCEKLIGCMRDPNTP